MYWLMKKFLIMGIAALAFISCSKDAIESATAPAGYQNDAAIANYANAFKATFGVPDPNQTWGFGNPVNPVNAMRRANAVIAGDPFTYETTEGYYKTEIPGTAVSPVGYTPSALQSVTELKLENGTFSINLWSGRRDIYVSGNVTLNVNSDASSINQARIYVLPNSTLTLNMDATYYYINDLEIYVAADGILNYNSTMLYNQTGGGKIYNRGTVNFLADEFQANNDAVIYNEGTVTGKSLKMAPNQSKPSFFYNFGELNLENDLILFSESNFLNEEKVIVNGNTELTGSVSDSHSLWWINKGHFETKNMVMHATNNNFYNFCQLLIEENFNLYEGEFNLMPNSYTEAATATFHMFYVNMYGDAGINIKGAVDVTSKYNNTYDQGFKYKDGTENYVLIGGKCSVNLQKGTFNIDEGITYSIKEIVILNGGTPVTEEYVRETYPTEYPVTILNTTSYVEFGNLTVEPKTVGCGATWTIGIIPPANTPSLHVMAEDLSVSDASDFDFNDCVIDVFYVDANTVTIKLLAAGGTLPLRINGDDNWEVHKLFDVPVTCMVNTGTKYHTAHAPYSQATRPYQTLTLTGKTWSSDQNTFAAQVNSQVKLEVYKDNRWIELTAEQGQPACKIATSVNIYMKDYDWYPEEYRWPWEKQNIGELFRHYVQHPTEQWYITK